jgi:ferrous iron transport protein B
MFMHRIGLHGKAVIPAVLGYGCNVPAVMATRILESSRDRFIASVIATMVPCAARMTIIFGLVGYYLGGNAALGIYLLNLIVIAVSGTILSRLLPEVTPGMILEIPKYQVPRIRQALLKTWLRLKDFIIIAWPLLIIGSVVLGLAEYFKWTVTINRLLSPITSLLGLPNQVGMTLIFGVLRKELSMLMLFQAMGTDDLLTVMTQGQILIFTVFVVFYIPCVATIGVLYKQVRWRATAAIVGFTFITALFMGLLTRSFAALIW